jgi:hypothetical protein
MKLFAEKNPTELRVSNRTNIIGWIIKLASDLDYTMETIHLAVFIIDAFLHSQTLKPIGWPLLGFSAFQLAAKMEEVKPKNISKVQDTFIYLDKFRVDEVIWMECLILTTLKFRINPSSAKLFVDLAVNSALIQFPSEEIKQKIKELAYKVLLKSLYDMSLSRFRNSLKAEFALQAATEYVLYYELSTLPFRQRNYFEVKQKANHLNHAAMKCYALFEGLVQSERTSPRKSLRGV